MLGHGHDQRAVDHRPLCVGPFNRNRQGQAQGKAACVFGFDVYAHAAQAAQGFVDVLPVQAYVALNAVLVDSSSANFKADEGVGYVHPENGLWLAANAKVKLCREGFASKLDF